MITLERLFTESWTEEFVIFARLPAAARVSNVSAALVTWFESRSYAAAEVSARGSPSWSETFRIPSAHWSKDRPESAVIVWIKPIERLNAAASWVAAGEPLLELKDRLGCSEPCERVQLGVQVADAGPCVGCGAVELVDR